MLHVDVCITFSIPSYIVSTNKRENNYCKKIKKAYKNKESFKFYAAFSFRAVVIFKICA